ncbi:unnamed protein product, partial [Didymodactylos carnosus]
MDGTDCDLMGISVAILGCYLAGLHLGYACFKFWRACYEIMIVILMTCVIFHYVRRPKKYLFSSVHVTIFVGVALLGFLPVLHWLILHGGFFTEIVQVFLPKFIALYSLLGVGMLFYRTKIPERLFP